MLKDGYVVLIGLTRVAWADEMPFESDVPDNNTLIVKVIDKINIEHSLILRQICPASRLTYVQDWAMV